MLGIQTWGRWMVGADETTEAATIDEIFVTDFVLRSSVSGSSSPDELSGQSSFDNDHNFNFLFDASLGHCLFPEKRPRESFLN